MLLTFFRCISRGNLATEMGTASNCKFVNSFLNPLLNGFGQVLLQENRLSGVLVIVGIFTGSVIEGVTALLSGALAVMLAQICRFPEKPISSGLYVFNAVLFGIAVVHFFPVSVSAVLVVLIGSAVVMLFTHLFLKFRLPAFTFPFILLSWLTVYSVGLPETAPLTRHPIHGPVMVLFTVLRDFAQIIFQSKLLSGLLFLLAILVNSGLSVIYALGATIISAASVYLFGFPPESFQSGALGYNAILCSLVFAGPRPVNLLRAFCTCILSTQIMLPFYSHHLIALTFPFVCATWTLLGITELVRRLQRETEYI